MDTHQRPPLRLDRHFLVDADNRMKFAQMASGAMALLLTSSCYPNRYVPYCSPQIFNFSQLFNAICVNGFFLVLTSLFALVHLFSIPDAFYQYNFPLLEKLYTTLAVALYFVGIFTAFNNVVAATFSFLWIFQVGATCATFLAYSVDCWRRWRRDSLKGQRVLV